MPSRSRSAPSGRYALLDKKFGAPTITNDGVTIARDIELEDPYENMGAQLLEEVATKTNDVAGDGTTTSIVLAQAIITEGLKNVTAGSNPMGLKRGIEKGVEAIVEEIKRLSKPVETKDDIAHIAAISARDTEIGDMIAEVMEKVGKDGVVTVEESQGLKLDVEYVEGMQLDRGYISPYFVDLDRGRQARGDPRQPVHPRHRQEDQRRRRHPAHAREDGPDRPAAPDHRRGRRRRGACHAGRQQAEGHDQRPGGQGARASAIAARRCSRTSRP